MVADTTGRSGGAARSRAASGRFVLRLPSALHETLRAEASEAGISLNELCVRKLAGVSPSYPGRVGELIARATEQFGKDLRGVVLYGSFARGEAATVSDIDIMIVLDPRVPLNLTLYHGWDSEEWQLDEHAIDIHFSHLPSTRELPSGLWAEIALDGKVLHESDLAVTRLLASVRRRIAAGELVRRTTHGQPYWVRGPDPCAT